MFNKMKCFTQSRNFYTSDEIWFVEHYPIFTQGCIKKKENIIISSKIPIVTTNRGGQITYHGPGQQILYFLIDLKRRQINIRQFIDVIKNAVISMLRDFFILAYFDKNYPGIYVNKKKICSIGLRIQNGCTLHGLSININMDLTPFNYIYPCGNKEIKMTQ
ncbi:lipoyl(octanoyl) transferase LipB, partial [Buchnera aphidicola]|nr:lipoyl(octanoyl) transferase LipB [Buchnera aphidicola]